MIIKKIISGTSIKKTLDISVTSKKGATSFSTRVVSFGAQVINAIGQNHNNIVSKLKTIPENFVMFINLYFIFDNLLICIIKKLHKKTTTLIN